MVYKLSRLGIGDLFLFCLEIKHQNISSLKIVIDTKTILTYRKNTPNYLDFCKEFLIKFLYDINLEFIENEKEKTYFENWKIIESSINSKKTIDFYSNLYQKNNDEDYYVLFTKIRDFNFSEYSKIKNNLYDKLNKNNKKIILLGEREVEYGVEYNILGKNTVYSIYNDIKNQIDSKLIIDKTIPKLGITLSSVENIINDMKIISNSIKTIILGRGGFFCLSLPTKKLYSLHIFDYVSVLPSLIGKEIFLDRSTFLNNL